MKRIKVLNFIAIINMVIINVFFIGKNIANSHFEKLLDNIVLFSLLLIPFSVRKIFKINLSELFRFLYYIYIIITILIGNVLNLIKYTLWYDKIVHGYFSFLVAIVALLIIEHNKINLKNKIFFNILFILGFTLLICNIHEFIEYGLDKIFHTNHQRWKQTGVNDTMQDLLIAFLSSILVSIDYFIEIKTKKMGLIFHSINHED